MKEEILYYLEQNKNKLISGQQMANKFHITRQGVWKAIRSLQAEGHPIQSVPNKGYRMNVSSNILSEKIIQQHLEEPIDLKVYPVCESTNTLLKQFADSKNKTMVLLSNQQTKGRGRYNRDFYSPKDTGLYLSILLPFQENDARIPYLTMIAAVSVIRSLKNFFHINPQIKWVNDIFYNGKKCGGILTEGILNFETNSISQAIVGIGLNLSNKSFPKELESIATSIDQEFSDRNLFAATLINEFFKSYREDLTAIVQEYKSYSCVIGKRVTFTLNNQHHEGVAIDITDKGHLLVECDGKKIELNSGEVSIRGDF